MSFKILKSKKSLEDRGLRDVEKSLKKHMRELKRKLLKRKYHLRFLKKWDILKRKEQMLIIEGFFKGDLNERIC
ncbi:MAG: hypothetical protein DRN26_03165 [Thermoplasmata archaeon]|nr:MAG: hypothetical protein DRN26_03165 [Thermoplasmata archaeon]